LYQEAERRIGKDYVRNVGRGEKIMLTQSEADVLFAIFNKTKSSNSLAFPYVGGELQSSMIQRVEGRK